MKRGIAVLSVVIAVALAGCGFLPVVSGSGNLVARSYTFGTFTKVVATHACELTLSPGSGEIIEVTFDDNLVEYLDVRRISDDTVLIGLQPGHTYVGTTFKADVRLPVLTGLDLSGASIAVAGPGFPAVDSFDATLSGASQADLRSLACGAFVSDLSGASTLTASGSATSVRLIVSGASTAYLLALPTQSASLDLSGASTCWIDIGTGPLDVVASGASSVHYRGTPALRVVDLSGGSTLVRTY